MCLLRSDYMIEFSAPDMVTKRVQIDGAAVPPSELNDGFTFDLDMSLFAYVEGFDESLLDTPIGIATFNERSARIEFDLSHTNDMRRKVANELDRVANLEEDLARARMRYDNAMEDGERAEARGRWEDAYDEYEKALSFIPGDEAATAGMGRAEAALNADAEAEAAALAEEQAAAQAAEQAEADARAAEEQAAREAEAASRAAEKKLRAPRTPPHVQKKQRPGPRNLADRPRPIGRPSRPRKPPPREKPRRPARKPAPRTRPHRKRRSRRWLRTWRRLRMRAKPANAPGKKSKRHGMRSALHGSKRPSRVPKIGRSAPARPRMRRRLTTAKPSSPSGKPRRQKSKAKRTK